TRVVVALPRVIEGALRIQKFDQRGFAAPIGIFHGVAYVSSLIQQVVLDGSHQFSGRGVLHPGVANLVLNFRLDGFDPRLDLLLLLPRTLDYALVPVEDRERRLEEYAQRIAMAVVELAMKLSTDGVVHLSLGELAADFGLRAGLILANSLQVGPK